LQVRLLTTHRPSPISWQTLWFPSRIQGLYPTIERTHYLLPVTNYLWDRVVLREWIFFRNLKWKSIPSRKKLFRPSCS